MERTLRQLHFCIQTLATIRACLTGIVGRHLMEMFTVPLGYPVAPLEEHTPRRIRDGFCKVSVLHHVARLQVFSNHGINLLVVEKIVCCLCNEVKTLAGNNIMKDSQCFLCLIPSVTSVSFTRQSTLQCRQLTFCLSIKAWIRDCFTI